jgi:hypothetical protein
VIRNYKNRFVPELLKVFQFNTAWKYLSAAVAGSKN